MGSEANKQESCYPFVKITEVSKLIRILESRLPQSCFIYNAAKMYPRFKDITDIAFYSLYGEIEESSWILMSNYREDYGRDYAISANEENSKISQEEFSKILSECKLFKWHEPYFFVCLEKWISKIVMNVSLYVKEMCTHIHPINLYYLDPQECIQRDVKCEDPSVEIKPLDSDIGLKFIAGNWKYALKGTDLVMKRLIENNESGGIYVNGKLVCALVTQSFGLVSALHTLKEYRKKGYAKLCMQFVFKELAKNGMIPSSSVEFPNKRSIEFHENKLGCKVACKAYYIFSA